MSMAVHEESGFSVGFFSLFALFHYEITKSITTTSFVLSFYAVKPSERMHRKIIPVH